MWVEEYLERERKSLRPSRAWPLSNWWQLMKRCARKYIFKATVGMKLDGSSGEETQYAVLFLQICFFQFCTDAELHQSACIYQHYRSFAFFVQSLFLSTTKNKKEKTSHQNRKVWRGTDGPWTAHSHHLSCDTSQITALKLHQWRTTTHSHIHPLAPDSFIPKKAIAQILHLSLPNTSFPRPTSLHYTD